MSSRLIVFLVLMSAVAASSAGGTSNLRPEEGAGRGVRPEHGWPRPPFPWPWWPTPSSPPPPPPPPPQDPWWCNRTYGEEALSSADDNVDCPPPPATTPPASCPWPCICPRWWRPSPTSVVTTASPTTDDHECRAQLAAVNNCGAFLMGDDDKIPKVTSPCCAGLRSVLNGTGAAVDTAPAVGAGVLLKCACALFLGDAHGLFPKPVSVERILYLPVACSTALPPELIYICYRKFQI